MKHTHWLLGAAAGLVSSIALAQGAPGGAPPAGGPPGGGGGGGGGDMMATITALFKTCEADTKAQCAGKEGPQALQCLLAAKDKLGAACKDALAKLPPPPGGGGGGGPPGGGAGGPPAGGPPPAGK